jgi:hypothetical protein
MTENPRDSVIGSNLVSRTDRRRLRPSTDYLQRNHVVTTAMPPQHSREPALGRCLRRYEGVTIAQPREISVKEIF